jgi:hypothetical protein
MKQPIIDTLKQYRICLLKQIEAIFQFIQKQKEQLFSLKKERDELTHLAFQFLNIQRSPPPPSPPSHSNRPLTTDINQTIHDIEALVQCCVQFYRDNRDNINASFVF